MDAETKIEILGTVFSILGVAGFLIWFALPTLTERYPFIEWLPLSSLMTAIGVGGTFLVLAEMRRDKENTCG